MKKLILILLFLTGCNEASTPQEAIDAFAKYANKNDLSSATDYLAFDAKDKFGTPEGFASLRKFAPISGIAGELTYRKVNSKGIVEKYRAQFSSPKANGEVLCNAYIDESVPAPVTYCWVDRIDL